MTPRKDNPRPGHVLREDDGRKWMIWPPEEIVQALQDYERLYGNSTAASFSPSAAKWTDRPELRERYLAGNPLRGRPWPSLNTIKSRFGYRDDDGRWHGSFDEARRAAGLKPNRSGPGTSRRPSHEHAPNREIRDRVLVLPPERARTAMLMQQRAQGRAKRLERKVAKLEKANARLQARVEELEGAAVDMVRELTA